MKAIKFFIVALLFAAAGQEVSAQNQVIVNNNTIETYTLQFNFAAPCGPLNMTAPGTSVTASGPHCPGMLLQSFSISFTDNTCNPPAPINLNINFTTNPTTYTYTRCDGTQIHFHIHFNGADYILDIN